jgi:hypothetical protein
MCDRPSTSREHVPPACFFPEADEFDGAENLRTNLITVPSFDEHNLLKSSDDQYISTVIAFHFENNPIAQAHFSAKIKQALMRKPAMFNFFPGLTPVMVGGSPSAAFYVDRVRFNRAMDCIAKGIYFHHFGKKYIGPSQVMSYSLFDITSQKRDRINASLQEWRQYSDRFLQIAQRYGDNPEIFYYQVINVIENHRIFVRLVFYEGFVVDVFFSNDKQESTDEA